MEIHEFVLAHKIDSGLGREKKRERARKREGERERRKQKERECTASNEAAPLRSVAKRQNMTSVRGGRCGQL